MEDQKINTYEISFLLDNAEDVQVITKHLKALKAEIILEGTIAQIQLAYPIDKKEAAYFGYIHYTMPAENTPKLNDILILDKKVIRFLIITPPPEKAIPRRMERAEKPEGSTKPSKKSEAALSNEALEEKLAALKAS